MSTKPNTLIRQMESSKFGPSCVTSEGACAALSSRVAGLSPGTWPPFSSPPNNEAYKQGESTQKDQNERTQRIKEPQQQENNNTRIDQFRWPLQDTRPIPLQHSMRFLQVDVSNKTMCLNMCGKYRPVEIHQTLDLVQMLALQRVSVWLASRSLNLSFHRDGLLAFP